MQWQLLRLLYQYKQGRLYLVSLCPFSFSPVTSSKCKRHTVYKHNKRRVFILCQKIFKRRNWFFFCRRAKIPIIKKHFSIIQSDFFVFDKYPSLSVLRNRILVRMKIPSVADDGICTGVSHGVNYTAVDTRQLFHADTYVKTRHITCTMSHRTSSSYCPWT